MRILFYRWKAYNQFDLIQNLEQRGHIVDEITGEMANYESDEPFALSLREQFDRAEYDLVMTVNFFPLISNECEKRRIRYVAWCCDSPISAMYNDAVFNKSNIIFTFDLWNQLEFKDMGAPVYYLPLCADTVRNDKITGGAVPDGYDYDISFVGSMYKKNMYDEVYDHMTDYLKGYFDAALKMQVNINEYMIEDILDGKILAEIERHFLLNKSEHSFQKLALTFSTTVLSFKIARLERQSIISKLSENYRTDIFTDDMEPEFGFAKKHGTVDYWSQAPLIYNRSKINLNLSLKSIRTGIPLRVFDILSCGGFCMTNNQPELGLYFKDGIDLVTFDSYEDLQKKTEYYLSHEDERKNIALNGYEKVKKLHQYSNRLDEMRKYIPEI